MQVLSSVALLLFLLGFLLFLYVGCEVGVWNWLVRHLIAQGIPESRALNILSLDSRSASSSAALPSPPSSSAFRRSTSRWALL